jgi:hypothetical protein
LFDITLSNYNCKIKIVSVKDEESLGSITSLKIRRREYLDAAWTIIKTIAITEADDLNYTYYDKYTRSRRTYEYRFSTYAGEIEVASVDYTIECNFDYLYISDASAEYILFLNLKYSEKSKTAAGYQELLQSKYPRKIQNGLSAYKIGTVEGIPLPLDARGNPTSVGAQKYKEQFMNFLENGLVKYIKGFRGEVRLVNIDPDPEIQSADAEGAEPVSFSWTEYGPAPLADL